MKLRSFSPQNFGLKLCLLEKDRLKLHLPLYLPLTNESQAKSLGRYQVGSRILQLELPLNHGTLEDWIDLQHDYAAHKLHRQAAPPYDSAREGVWVIKICSIFGHLFNILNFEVLALRRLAPELSVTMLNDTVSNYLQCGQSTIFEPWTHHQGDEQYSDVSSEGPSSEISRRRVSARNVEILFIA